MAHVTRQHKYLWLSISEKIVKFAVIIERPKAESVSASWGLRTRTLESLRGDSASIPPLYVGLWFALAMAARLPNWRYVQYYRNRL